MSDAPENDFATSAMDPAFAAAWELAYSSGDEDGEYTGPSAAEAAGSGDATSAPEAEGAAAEGGDAPAQAEGVVTNPFARKPEPDPAAAAAAGGPEATDAAATAPEPVVGFAFADVAPLLEEAGVAIDKRAEEAFRAEASRELETKIGPEWADALSKHPRMLVGQSVPNLQNPDGPDELIRDSDDAREWQEAARQLISGALDDAVKQKKLAAAPTLAVFQESIMMFRNNPDIMPGSAEFDKELADEFTAIAGDYVIRANGKKIGYQMNVQPLLNKLRERRAAAAGGNAVVAQQQAARQAQAAAQARTQQGQFTKPVEQPQAAIPTKAGSSGESEEDYSTFMSASGLGGMIV